MKDYRGDFLKEVEQSLVGLLDQGNLDKVIDRVTVALNNYEITERCTELIPAEDVNQKILQRYLACIAIEGRAEKTIKQYRRTVEKLADTICKPYNEMGVYDIRYYLACGKQRGLSNASLENTRANLSAFFKWMSKEGITERNIMESVAVIKVPKEVRDAFSDIEVDELRSGCRNLKERALIEFLLATGVRMDELSKMDIGDIDFQTMTVHVRHGKGSKERITYISNVAKKHLTAYLESREDTCPPLFLNYRHKRITNGGIRAILSKIAVRAGAENVHPHRFRRTFATGLAARGMDIQEIQRLLGHTNINTTMKYIRINDAQVQASYRRFIA